MAATPCATLRRALAALSLVVAGVSSAVAGEAEVVRSGFAKVPGGRIYYEASGIGPHLVLISGGNGMDLREWDGQFLRLATTFQVIRCDPRGSGGSDTPTGSFSPYEDLHALLDQLGIRKVHLVGPSSAGGVAIDFALAYPDRLSSLVLVGATVGGYEFSEEFRKRNASLLAILKKNGVKRFVKAALDDDYLIPTGFLTRRRATGILRSNAKRLLLLDPSWVHGLEPPAFGRLSEIHVPTLVVVGEDDHPEVRRLSDLLVAGIPNAREVVVPRSAHMVHMERTRKFNHLVADFLAGTARN